MFSAVRVAEGGHSLKLVRVPLFSGIAAFLALLPLLAFRFPPESDILLTWPGHRMFEDFSARSEVSPDGNWVLRTFVDGNQELLRLPAGTSDNAALQGGLHDFERAAWCGNQLLRLGTDSGKRAWFTQSVSGLAPLVIPPEATPVCDLTGE